jgi:hypothetical protein
MNEQLTYEKLKKAAEALSTREYTVYNTIVLPDDLYYILVWQTRFYNVHRHITNCRNIPKSIKYRGCFYIPNSELYLKEQL